MVLLSGGRCDLRLSPSALTNPWLHLDACQGISRLVPNGPRHSVHSGCQRSERAALLIKQAHDV